MFVLGYIGALLTGISLGLIGGGGSTLIVPVLVYLFGVSPTLATAYSLFVVGFASLFGAFEYAKQNLIDYRTAATFAAPAFLGVFLVRRFGLPLLPEELFFIGSFVVTKPVLIMSVFAIMMVLASGSMIRQKKTEASDTTDTAPQYNYPLIGIEGLLVGGLTGFVGAGGGFLIIPALVVLAKIPMKRAVATSLVIIAAKSILGFMGDIGSGQDIDWVFLLSITGIAIVGIFLGTKLSHHIPGERLKPAFGWFVLAMGIFILGKQLV